MATKPILPTLTRAKLYRPPLPADWVPRPQLLEQLRQERQRPLTLVSAPAGFGKSTLLSAWLEDCEWHSAWLSLDENDNDLVTFLSYVVAAIRTLFPEFGTDTQTLLNAVSKPPLPVFVSSLSNDLDEINEPFLLALDDYHVIHQPDIHDLLLKMVNNPPRALHLVLATRHDPPLPIVMLRARAAISEIRSPDLRFTLPETLAFLRRTLDPQIDEVRATFLNEKTEGWVAGLRLTALSAGRRNSEIKLAALDVNNVYLMDYLANEVLAQQPAALQEFLIKTSILDRLYGPLCEAVALENNLATSGQIYLTWLEEINLFIVPLDDRRQWFRYHQLFKQLLRHQLERLYHPNDIAELHRRAGHWLSEQGLLEEALQHALLAGDPVGAGQIVIQQRHELINQDAWRRLEDLCQVLPPSVIETQPELLLAKAWCAQNRYNLPQVFILLEQAERLLEQQAVTRADEPALRGEVEFFRTYRCFWTNDVAGVQTHAQQALPGIPLNWWYARSLVRLFLASGHYMLGHTENVSQILAAGLTESENNTPALARNFVVTCFLHWFAGDLQAVADAAEQVLALDGKHYHTQTGNWAHYFKGIVYYQRNQLAEAEQEFSEVVLDRYRTHMQCLVNSTIALVFTYQAQQRPGQAQAIADMLPTFLHETGNTSLLPIAHAFRAELALRQKRLADASQWAAQARPNALSLMPYFFSHDLVLPKIQLALDTPDGRAAAAEQLRQVCELAESRHVTYVLIEVLALQALLFERQGDRATALTTLERAIHLAQPGGFIRSFVDLGPALQTLLHLLDQRGVAPYFVQQILDIFAAEQPIELRPDPQALELIEPLTNRELEVLALLAQHLSNKEIAARLCITPHTTKLHTLHIYQKLQVNTRRDAVSKAQSLGLLRSHS